MSDTVQFSFKVSPEQAKVLRAAAKKANVPFALWVREVCLAAAGRYDLTQAHTLEEIQRVKTT